ncbi:MAG: hypothetical protein IPM83_16070 [Ignavibacteria bacterium]|nr:hypothetical protein [Ignavibacteria bacterium]
MTDDNGRITRFLEKPSWGEVFSDTINTGIYILEPMLWISFRRKRNSISARTSIRLCYKKGLPLFGYVADGY